MEFQRLLMLASLWGAGICFLAWALVICFKPFSDAYRRNCKMTVPKLFLVVPLIIAMMLHGSTKRPSPMVSFPYTDPDHRYFIDTGSRIEDEGVWLSFRSIGIPTSADFIGCFRPLASTSEEDWVPFLQGTVGEYLTPQLILFADAKNFNFCFFSTFTAGPTVHTNGVLNVNWGVPLTSRDGVVDALPIRSVVNLNGQPVATPASSILTNEYYRKVSSEIIIETEE